MEAAVSLTALLTAVGVGAIVLRGQVDGARLQATLLPLIYPGVFYILLFDLTFAGAGMPLTLLFVLLFLVPSMNDCFALFTGMACGKHKLSPHISPKKTIEGSVGGLVAAVVFAMLLPRLVCLFYGADASALAPMWYYALLASWPGRLRRSAIWPRRSSSAIAASRTLERSSRDTAASWTGWTASSLPRWPATCFSG